MSDSHSTEHKSTWLFSLVGVLAVLALLIVVNLIARTTNLKADLTEHKLHTLTEGTKNILGKLDKPVTLRLYATQDKNVMPLGLREYGNKVRDMLLELEKRSNGFITVEQIDPEPDSDEEDNARMNGIRPQPIERNTQVYLGLAVSCPDLDKKVAVSFLDPRRDSLLEYDLARSILEVTKDQRTKIGIMSGLPISGGPPNFQTRQPGAPAWFFYQELQRDFDVTELKVTDKKIDSEIDTLVIVHPNGITDETQYAIDQYLLGGGKVLAFLDSYSIYANQTQQQQQGPVPNPQQQRAGVSSNLSKLLPAWGFTYENVNVAADLDHRTQLGGGQQIPAVITLGSEVINQEDTVTNQIDEILMVFAGAFYGDPKDGLTQDILLHTSENTQMVNPQRAETDGEKLMDDFEPEGKELTLAMRLTGTFKTAFPAGKPKSSAADPEGEEDKADPDPDEEEESETLKESKQEGVVILVADSDMLFDNFAVRIARFGNQQIPMGYQNGNIPFTQNSVEQLAGDTDLIKVRSRGSSQRPFTKFQDMMKESEETAKEKIKELQKKRDEAQQKLTALQQNKAEGQEFVISPEQRAEIEKFEGQSAATNKELRQVRRDLRKDVDKVETYLQALNIGGVPLIIVLIGVGHFLIRKSKTSAR